MLLQFKHKQQSCQVDTSEGLSLAITLDFNAEQVNHFAADQATATTMQSGDWLGNTQQGGSCNVKTLTLNPHCNGSHTESISHLVDELISPSTALANDLFHCALVSVAVIPAKQTNDQYSSDFDNNDQVIDQANLNAALQKLSPATLNTNLTALVIRSLPNETSKKKRQYNAETQPAFFTTEAMQLIRNSGIQHLLVDLPSIDRMHDQGKLSNHRVFWGLPETGHQLTATADCKRTISELIFSPNDISDGFYLLNLQVPDLLTDAVPCRPILYPIKVL